MTRAILLGLGVTSLLALASCAPVALRPLHLEPPVGGSVAPDGCDWVVREKQGNDTLYLCCAVPPKLEPVCKEAGFYDRKD